MAEHYRNGGLPPWASVGPAKAPLVQDDAPRDSYHQIRDHVKCEDTAVPGNENPAGIFTKTLGRLKFAKFRAMLGLRP